MFITPREWFCGQIALPGAYRRVRVGAGHAEMQVRGEVGICSIDPVERRSALERKVAVEKEIRRLRLAQ